MEQEAAETGQKQSKKQRRGRWFILGLVASYGNPVMDYVRIKEVSLGKTLCEMEAQSQHPLPQKGPKPELLQEGMNR